MACVEEPGVGGRVGRFVPGEGGEGKDPDLVKIDDGLLDSIDGAVGREDGAAVEEDLRGFSTWY